VAPARENRVVREVRVVLVRHGEARAGVDRIIGGDRGCRGLTDRGRAQAAALRDRLTRTSEVRPDAVYASTLPRAIETAEIVAEAFPHVSQVRRERGLCEQEPGECDGMHFEAAVERYAPDFDDVDCALSPGGESTRAFDARVRRAVDAVVDAHSGETVMIVSHGGFISSACLYVLGAPGLDVVHPFRLWPENTSLTEFTASSTPPWLLHRYNDAAHLL
jgi:2,3-bisphosphoglycerate-dependent phosphoglycerate mutase